MTHVLDTSASLAALLNEPGGERVKAILRGESNLVGISALSIFEVDTAVFHRTGSQAAADAAVAQIRQVVEEVVPVTETIADLARELRQAASSRIATVDCLTAAHLGATLVHRAPHFASLPAGKPAQEALPDKG